MHWYFLQLVLQQCFLNIKSTDKATDWSSYVKEISICRCQGATINILICERRQRVVLWGVSWFIQCVNFVLIFKFQIYSNEHYNSSNSISPMKKDWTTCECSLHLRIEYFKVQVRPKFFFITCMCHCCHLICLLLECVHHPCIKFHSTPKEKRLKDVLEPQGHL